MENTNTNTTAIATKEDNKLALALTILNEVDFEGLNNIIDKLGNNSNVLTVEEKQAASEIINEWQNDVIDKLQHKYHETSGVLAFFGVDDNSYRFWGNKNTEFTEDQKMILAEQTDTKELYEKCEQLLVEIQDHQLERPDNYIEDPDLSYNANLLARKDNEKLHMLYNMEHTKLTKAREKAEATWIKALKKDKKIKDLISTTRKYNNNIEKLKSDCKNKSNLAKLGINVSSLETREALKELLSFAKTI